MAWLHQDAIRTGKVTIVDGSEVIECDYDIGGITTGRQRVFSRFYIRVTMPDGSHEVGEDQHGFRAALRVLGRVLGAKGKTLIAAGLRDEFAESGLSWNSGYGWYSDCQHAVHMMDAPPLRRRDHDNDKFVEALIREAVDGMRIGLTQNEFPRTS